MTKSISEEDDRFIYLEDSGRVSTPDDVKELVKRIELAVHDVVIKEGFHAAHLEMSAQGSFMKPNKTRVITFNMKMLVCDDEQTADWIVAVGKAFGLDLGG